MTWVSSSERWVDAPGVYGRVGGVVVEFTASSACARCLLSRLASRYPDMAVLYSALRAPCRLYLLLVVCVACVHAFALAVASLTVVGTGSVRRGAVDTHRVQNFASVGTPRINEGRRPAGVRGHYYVRRADPSVRVEHLLAMLCALHLAVCAASWRGRAGRPF